MKFLISQVVGDVLTEGHFANRNNIRGPHETHFYYNQFFGNVDKNLLIYSNGNFVKSEIYEISANSDKTQIQTI